MRSLWLALIVLAAGLLGLYAGNRYGPGVQREHAHAEEWRGKFNQAVSAAGEREIRSATTAAWASGFEQYKAMAQYWRKQAEACRK